MACGYWKMPAMLWVGILLTAKGRHNIVAMENLQISRCFHFIRLSILRREKVV